MNLNRQNIVKTILTLFLALTVTGLRAAPTFQPQPGTSEAATNESATSNADKVIKAMNDLEVALGKTNAGAAVEAKPVTKSLPVVTPNPAPVSNATVVSTTTTTTTTASVPVIVTPPVVVTPAPTVVTPAPVTNVPTRFSRVPRRPTANPNANAAPTADPNATALATQVSPIVQFQAMPLEQFLDYYSKTVGKTILRPAQLPAASITLKTQTELTRTELIQALDTVLGMNGITMIPMGEKFIKVVQDTAANQAGAPIDNNSSSADLPDMGSYITHVVQLHYSKPSEISTVLGNFAKIQGSITPLDNNGILIIRDYTENVKRMLELIEKIDVSVPSEFVSEVIPIKYALASDIASALNSVGGGSTSSIGGTTSTAGGAAGYNRTGTGATGGQRTGFGVNANGNGTTANGVNRVGNNTGGAAGFGGNNGAGVAGVAGGQQQTFAQRLQNIIRSTGAGSEFQILGPNKIIPDERMNALLVFASRQDMDMITNIVAKLDTVLAQVLIEAMILDVRLGDNLTFGVSAGQQPMRTPSVVGGGSYGSGSQLNSGGAFLNNLISRMITNGFSQVITNGITNMIPIIATVFDKATNLNYQSSGGLNYFGQFGGSWDVAVNAIAGNNKARVLARPSIQTSHNAPATIFVGETRPYVTGTTTDLNGTPHSTYQQTQIGISLNVTPLINPDGLVVMDIQQQVQQVGGNVQIGTDQVPITTDQNASAKVAVKSGDTIVMGGFIQNSKSTDKSGIPLLQDIPLLGLLFRTTATTSARRELVVLIRPTVLPTPEAAALQPKVELNRLPTVKRAKTEFEEEDAKLLKAADKDEKKTKGKKTKSEPEFADPATLR